MAQHLHQLVTVYLDECSEGEYKVSLTETMIVAKHNMTDTLYINDLPYILTPTSKCMLTTQSFMYMVAA